MFERWGSAVVRHPVRVIVAWLVVVTGLGALGYLVLGPEGPAAVSGQNQTDFLPESYESVRAARFAEQAFPSGGEDGATAVLVLSRADGAALGPTDQAEGRRAVAGLGGPGVRGVSEPSMSPNGRVMLAQVTFTAKLGHPEVSSAVGRLRDDTAERFTGTPLRSGYTGAAAVAKDTERLNLLVSVGMIVMILILLVVIFRSPWVALLNLLIIALVGQGAVAVIAIAAKLAGTTLDGSVTGLLPVVLFGVGTDYVVFLLYRYRERLRLGEDRRTAMVAALGRVGSAIGVSAVAVAVSFGALLLSGFGSFQILGPALAFAVLVMVLAGLTLIPAVFSLLGHRAFWPSKAWRNAPKAGLAARTGLLVARRPAAVALAAVAILAALGSAALAHRIREELRGGASRREAVRVALREAGPPVAAAGVILAASFGALTISATLAEVGFAVAVGVLLSTFVLSWLLVPALTTLLGRAAFWPARVGRTVATPETAAEPAPESARETVSESARETVPKPGPAGGPVSATMVP